MISKATSLFPGKLRRPGAGHAASSFARRLGPCAVLALAISGPVAAQPAVNPLRAETVSWSVSAPAGEAVSPGSRLALTVRGAVLDGWHVYGLKQLPTGPTPLLVSLDPAAPAKADGATSGSPAIKFHDPAFDLETQYYAKAFTLTVPVRLASKLPAGRQVIPVNVRFQTCNGEICQPPRTVKLSATVNVRAAG